jgi:hypothetical protein
MYTVLTYVCHSGSDSAVPQDVQQQRLLWEAGVNPLSGIDAEVQL